MKEPIIKKLFSSITAPFKKRDAFWGENDRKGPIIIISLLGAWIVSIPYEGRLLYALAENFGLKGSEMLDISLGMQIIGLVLGGVFIRTIRAARNILKYALPVCVLGTVTFFFPSYTVWMISLVVCSTLAGVCITASGQFIRICITYENRFRTAALMLINISVLKMVINNIALLISVKAAAAFTIIMLAAAWLLTIKAGFKDSITPEKLFNKKAGIKALVLLFLFIAIISIDFGIMTQVVNPKYDFSVFSSWYWLLPYVGAATIMMRLRNSEDRGTMLYVAVGMIGLGFLLSLTLDYSVISFLIVNTVMMGAWAISDVFWWSILVEMLDMVKNHGAILSVGFSGVMIGVLAGKLIAGNDFTDSNTSLSIVTMAVICITLIILPMLQKLLSMMIKKNSEGSTSELNTERGDNAESPESPRAYWDDSMLNFPEGADALTEREKQIAALLLKGRTYKLIAEELFLSENTVKTHVKNIYSKLGIKRKSELFNFIMK